MTGPHQSIIWAFSCGGHGAAVWSTHWSDEPSYASRTSCGSFSSRVKWVGTAYEVVTPCSSMSRSVSSASHFRRSTIVEPSENGTKHMASGPAWYSGALHRTTPSDGTRYSDMSS